MAKTSVKVRLTAVVLLISLAGMFIVAGLSYYLAHRTTLQESLDKIQNQAAYESGKIENLFNNYKTFVSSFGSSYTSDS